MRVRKNGFHVAVVNDSLVNFYLGMHPDHKGNMPAIICHLIETELIYRPILTKKDMDDAAYYARNLCFGSVGEWVNDQLRKRVVCNAKLCLNCAVKGENGYCPLIGGFVNPNQEACATFSRIRVQEK